MSKEETPIDEFCKELIEEIQEGTSLSNIIDKVSKREKAKVLEALESTSIEKAYKAGQQSVYCGCYEIKDCTTFAEWITTKQK